EKRVGRITESKEGQHAHECVETTRKTLHGVLRVRRVLRVLGMSVGFGNEQNQQYRDRARNNREREQRSIPIGKEQEKQAGEGWTDDRAHVVHRAMESIYFPPGCWLGPGGEHRITRRSADSFSDTIEHADRENLDPRSS